MTIGGGVMVDPSVIRLGLARKALGAPDPTDFTGRLINQKLIYLLQIWGLDLGYRFRWYLYGPYSSMLSENVFESASPAAKSTTEQQKLTKKVSDEIQQFLEEIDCDPTNRTDYARWIELISSLHYIRHFGGLDSPDFKSCSKRLKELEKDFDQNSLKKGWDWLQSHDLIEKPVRVLG